MSHPPSAFAASALFDTLLQEALRHFFARATFETEAVVSASSDGRLAIEPTDDPAALVIRWFGARHTLHAADGRAFSAHEVRFAQAIGAVLEARYRAIFDPRLMAERGDLFRGHIEDRYVGVFLERSPYRIGSTESRADRIADAIEVLRVAAISRYENRAISSGALLLDADADPCRPDQQIPDGAYAYSHGLTAIKSFYRLCDGQRTVFLVNREGVLFNVVDIERWADEYRGRAPLPIPCARSNQAHARATLDGGHVCVVLSPSHEIRVFAEGRQMFAFRNANWSLLDLEAKYEAWVRTVGHASLAERLFQTALDLSDQRQGGLFVVLRDPAVGVPALVPQADQLDGSEAEGGVHAVLSRRDMMHLLTSRTVTELDASVLAALARIDGATVMDQSGRLLAIGTILQHAGARTAGPHRVPVVEGARTTAALAASRFGSVLKVSEDGVITCFDGDDRWDL